MLRVRAYAKINLSLEVVGKRPDGFHDLVSVMQTISVADSLAIRAGSRISLICSDPDLSGPANLVERAARALQVRCGTESGCEIQLEKRIPVAAGLGGGSSDAAATLAALTRLWDLPAGCAELIDLATELGSDVPFFLFGGTALVEGRGERISPLPPPDSAWYLLVKPSIRVSTASVYSALPRAAWTDGGASRQLAASIRAHQRAAFALNALQQPLFDLHPQARACFERVRARAPGPVIVSGSGPTVVAMVETRQEAHTLARALEPLGYWTEIAHSVNSSGWETPCAP
jgi:4-diphosphocytidyl-2-C-methyl-D-erythritol kinase